MTLKNLISLLKSDLVSYQEPFWKSVLFIPGYKYTFHHRLCYFLYSHKILFPFFILEWLYLKHLTYLFGIQTAWTMCLPEHTTIAHFGGITFFPEKCGKGVYLRQGVTVGSNGKPKTRNPILGENIKFGANSIVIGPITIGNNVTIAAGAVVTKDIPDNCVVAGVPAKIIRNL